MKTFELGGNIKTEPATERQKEYAKKLGLEFPADITKTEMSELIARKVDDDEPASDGLKQFATARGLPVSRYIGESALYALLFALLSESSKLDFFVFSVYRWLSGEPEANLDRCVRAAEIQRVARQLALDERAIRSLLRYTGKDLRFFGLAMRGGAYVHGGSDSTIAYKEARRLLIECGAVAATRRRR